MSLINQVHWKATASEQLNGIVAGMGTLYLSNYRSIEYVRVILTFSNMRSCHRLVLKLKPIPGHVFTKLFRIRIKIGLNLNNILLTTFFKTYYKYSTFDCWYLIKYVLRTRLLGILSFFMKESVNFIVATVIKMWAH